MKLWTVMATAALLTLIAGASQAAVTYEYNSGIGEFTLTTRQYVKLGSMYTSQDSDLSCSDCTSVAFATLFNDSAQPDDVSFNEVGGSGYSYFDADTFQEDGTHVGTFGSIDVTGSPDGVSAAPEPSTWLLMFAGIGGIGMMLRRAKRTTGVRFKDAFTA